MMNPMDIAQKKFEKALGFGYRMDDVEEYLSLVASEVQNLIEEKADLEKKLEVLADKLNEYREDEESLRTAILSAQKLGDSLIRESKTKAEIIMRDATIKADALVGNARRQIERENDTLVRIQKESALFKNRLIEVYKQHLELIMSLPDDDEKEKKSAPETKKEEKAAPAPAPAPVHHEEEREEEATIEFASPAEEKEAPPINKEVSLTPDEENALNGNGSPLPYGEIEPQYKNLKENEEEPSLRSSFDESELDDEELDFSFFNKATSKSHDNKKKEMRFGQSFKM